MFPLCHTHKQKLFVWLFQSILLIINHTLLQVVMEWGKEKQRKWRKWRKRENDIQWLDSTVERYFLHGLAESTRKTYNSAKRRYSEFASKHGFLPLPASEHQLCQFVCHQAEGKLCHSTIKCYLSAVRQMHVAEGYGDPRMSSMARLEQVLTEGHKVPPVQNQGRESPPICCSK